MIFFVVEYVGEIFPWFCGFSGGRQGIYFISIFVCLISANPFIISVNKAQFCATTFCQLLFFFFFNVINGVFGAEVVAVPLDELTASLIPQFPRCFLQPLI